MRLFVLMNQMPEYLRGLRNEHNFINCNNDYVRCYYYNKITRRRFNAATISNVNNSSRRDRGSGFICNELCNRFSN